MPIRLSGLNSGLDTDAIVKELVNAYSLKTQKYEKQKTKLEWKQAAWKTLNTKIYSLYTNVSNLRRTSAYNLKKTTVSDATKAKVTASSGAVAGTQKLQIKSTAQAAYITGGKLGADVTASSTLGSLGYSGGETSIEVRTKGGDTKEIKLSSDMKISEVVEQLKGAGLNANFDETNKRFFVSAKESGEAGDFDLCATDANSQELLSKLGLDRSLVEYDTQGNKGRRRQDRPECPAPAGHHSGGDQRDKKADEQERHGHGFGILGFRPEEYGPAVAFAVAIGDLLHQGAELPGQGAPPPDGIACGAYCDRAGEEPKGEGAKGRNGCGSHSQGRPEPEGKPEFKGGGKASGGAGGQGKGNDPCPQEGKKAVTLQCRHLLCSTPRRQ